MLTHAGSVRNERDAPTLRTDYIADYIAFDKPESLVYE